MAQVFQQALGGQQPGLDPYQMLLAELQKQQPAPRPMFTPEQVQQRIAQNNRQIGIGLLGQLAGDDALRGVGGQVFRQALAGRQEQKTARGMADPLTGEEAISPEYQEQQQARQGKLLQLALAKQQRDEAIAARQQRLDDQQAHREEMARLTASLRPGRAGADPEISELRKDLIRAQIAKLEGAENAAADKTLAAAGKARTAAENAVGKAGIIINRVDEALRNTGVTTTGFIGSQVGKIPGTPAYDLQKTIDTIKANIGFEELQAMRQASPTGGALGQVAVRELDMLQAVLGNLDHRQSREQVESNLRAIRQHFTNWQQTMQAAAADAAARESAIRPQTPAGQATAGGPRVLAPYVRTPGAPGPVSPSPSGPPPGMSPQEWAELQELRQRFNR